MHFSDRGNYYITNNNNYRKGFKYVTSQVKTSLFRQGSPFSTRLVSVGALRRSELGVVTARVRYVPSGS